MELRTIVADTTPYSASQVELESLLAWKNSDMRPSIMVCAPAYDVGEKALVDELADASYRLQGFKDARRRHYISRRYPRGLSESAMARFVDHAFDVSEVSDGFRGVDSIDVSDWLGCQGFRNDACWRRLILYVRDHGETDFVFLAYGDDPSAAMSLATELSTDCGVAVLPIALGYPSAAKLAEVFIERDRAVFEPHRDYVTKRFADACATGHHITYATARVSADAASHEIAVRHDAKKAIAIALSKAIERTAAKTKRPFQIGFIGGER